jgi:hypothetical protein
MSTIYDNALREAFAPLRSLEPTDAEVARVIARAHRPRVRVRALPRLAIAALAAAALVSAGYLTADPVRAAIDSVTGTFSGWLGGDSSEAPGRPLGSDEQAPAYFRDPHHSDPRVIAEAGGYRLVAVRAADGTVDFDLGSTGVGIGQMTAGDFRDRALFVLGPGAVRQADAHGHVPLFGVTARSVASVELTYASGPPLRIDGIDGGFVLLAEPARRPRAVVAFDAGGREVGRAPVDDSPHFGPQIDWSQYLPTTAP